MEASSDLAQRRLESLKLWLKQAIEGEHFETLEEREKYAKIRTTLLLLENQLVSVKGREAVDLLLGFGAASWEPRAVFSTTDIPDFVATVLWALITSPTILPFDYVSALRIRSSPAVVRLVTKLRMNRDNARDDKLAKKEILRLHPFLVAELSKTEYLDGIHNICSFLQSPSSGWPYIQIHLRQPRIEVLSSTPKLTWSKVLLRVLTFVSASAAAGTIGNRFDAAIVDLVLKWLEGEKSSIPEFDQSKIQQAAVRIEGVYTAGLPRQEVFNYIPDESAPPLEITISVHYRSAIHRIYKLTKAEPRVELTINNKNEILRVSISVLMQDYIKKEVFYGDINELARSFSGAITAISTHQAGEITINGEKLPRRVFY